MLAFLSIQKKPILTLNYKYYDYAKNHFDPSLPAAWKKDGPKGLSFFHVNTLSDL